MRRIDHRTVELNEYECKASDYFDELLDAGESVPSAANLVRRRFEISDSFYNWLIDHYG